jgi:phage terminase large subunit-like protein
VTSKPSLPGCPPRHSTPATSRPSYAAGVAETAASLGWELMPWQRLAARVGLEHEGGRLIHRDVDVAVPRQQGKSSLVLALIIHRMLAAPGQWLVYGAQSRLAARRRLLKVWWPRLRGSPLGGLFTVARGTGSESLEAANGSLLTLLSIDESAAHGDVVDLGILDECWALDADAEQAVRPGMLTKPNAQLWRLSTAGNAKSVYWRSRVDAGRTAAELGVTDGAAYLEWAALADQDPADPATWRGCMPALGYTISPETVAADLASGMPLAEFKRSHLNLWPDETHEGWKVIDRDLWAASRL